MIVQKHIEKKVLRDYFFIEGTIDIDVSYFIKKIKEGFESGENRSHVTNVKGEMTNWLWFNKDPKFLEILNPGMLIFLIIDLQLSWYFHD